MTDRRVALSVLFLLVASVVCGFVAVSAVDRGASDSRRDAPTGLAFHDVAPEAGFDYANDVARHGMMSNAGVYAADYDGDGWTDLLAVGDDRPVLFANENGTFRRSGQLSDVDRTIRAATFFDYDGDGWLDLLLLPDGGTPVMLDNDHGTLTRANVGFEADLSVPMGATAGDYDGDGCPDLFVFQNGNWSDHLPAGQGAPDNDPHRDNGAPNLLFDGNCESFENVTGEAGIRGARWSLAASAVDLNGDGRPDIHVANDFNHDVVYWNRGDGSFRQDVLGDATNRNGMSSEVVDANGDGRLDVFVTNIHFPPDFAGQTTFVGPERARGNTLLINRANGSLVDNASAYGVRRGGWGWAAVGTDLDNDGDTDLFHATMNIVPSPTTGLAETRRLRRLRRKHPVYSYPAVFERRRDDAGPYLKRNPGPIGFNRSDGRGVAQLDFDRDGDVDIAVATAASPSGTDYRLYENRATGAALQIRLVGNATLGSRVFVTTGERTVLRVHTTRTDYLSQDARVLHFGASGHSKADVRVVWPDGTERTFADVETDRRLVISRDGVERSIPLGAGAGAGESARAAADRPPLAIAGVELIRLAAIVAGMLVVSAWYGLRARS